MQNEKCKVPLPLIVFPSLSLNDYGVVETFERLNMYSKKFSSARGDKNAKLIVLIRHTSSYDYLREKFSSLEIISTGRGLFSLMFGAVRYFKSRNTYPSTIIAGDPWERFCCCSSS